MPATVPSVRATSSAAVAVEAEPEAPAPPREHDDDKPIAALAVTWKTVALMELTLPVFLVLLAWNALRATGPAETPLDTEFGGGGDDGGSGANFTWGGDMSRFWGTWRPQLYFGTRTRSPHTLLTGLMWFGLTDYYGTNDIRHQCRQDQDIRGYGYDVHNGRNYSHQTIRDNPANAKLTTEWVLRPGGAHGGDWIARIKGERLDPNNRMPLSLLYYGGIDGNGRITEKPQVPRRGNGNRHAVGETLRIMSGRTKELGDFSLFVRIDQSSISPEVGASTVPPPRMRTWRLPRGSVWTIGEQVAAYMQALQPGSYFPRVPPAELYVLDDRVSAGDNVAVTQLTFADSFEFDIVFVSHSAHPQQPPEEVAGQYHDQFGSWARYARGAFDVRFERTFGLAAKGYDADHIAMGKYALSNLLGGMGYYYGTSRMNDAPEFADEATRRARAKRVPPKALFTATPSRPLFARGFLWDEGFHQLVVQHWDRELSLQSLESWYRLVDADGWVGREQMLGDETRYHVPEGSFEQRPWIANPPTLLLPTEHMLETVTPPGKTASSSSSRRFSFARQMGNSISSVVVRTGETDVEGPAGSGIDLGTTAFLNATFPTMLRHWEWYRRTQAGVADKYGRSIGNGEVYRWRGRDPEFSFPSGLDDYPRPEPPHVGELNVDLQAWMIWQTRVLEKAAKRVAADDDVVAQLRKVREDATHNLFAHFWSASAKMFADRGVAANGTTIFDPHVGYVAILPLALELLDPVRDKAQFDASLAVVRELAAPGHGMRSLSDADPGYGKVWDYWRGKIWINVNFLALRALRRYAAKHGHGEARRLHDRIRAQLVQTVARGFRDTGFLIENYRGETGDPSGAAPFTGWTSLVLLIMADLY